ncbi:hypothetical protein [Paenibacillus sp. N3.4]|uniref:hypothetical protein n=1 Tax=Paenibacillus sp. N3.4 TaxID=2603222 RepID=UPI0011C9053C|nr:hypothetical protein [Paenibacillus sp. N3.4]TXK82658.1 hypothetical protein FU659_14320 [Paenibacillus sp. N3.4]
MIRKLTSISLKHTSFALLLTGSLAAASWAAPAAHAASEAIYISNSSYFTLNQAALSSSSLQFSVALHNGEGSAIDFNQYGVRVTDKAGHSYTAKLSEKKSASVLPGQDQTFRFYSNLAAGETADQLQVDVFRWDFSKPDFMNHLGVLPVASVVQDGQVNVPEQIINLRTLDSTLANDASIAFRLGQSVRVSENGKWYLYTQVSAKNLGSSSVKVPTGLQARLVDADGLKYASTIVSSDTTFLPNQSDTITLKTLVSKQMSTSGLTLEYYYLNQSEDVSLGTLNMNASLQTAALGTKQSYAGQQDGDQVTVKATKSTYSNQADGVHVQTVVTLSNDGQSVASVPSFFASYQFGEAGTSSVTSTDNSTRSAYLAPKETSSYYFNAILPAGVDPNATQLVLWQKTTASTSSSSSTGAASGTTTGSTGSTTTTGSASNPASTATNGSSGQMPVAVFLLKGATEAQSGFTTAVKYELGTKLAFNDSSVVNKNLDVSLVELHAHENDDLGYKTAVAKYKITNNGTSTIALPVLQNELIDSNGNAYTGSRQSQVATQITPGSSYVVSYSYLLPNKTQTDSETFALNIFDDKSVSEGNVSIGSYQVALQKDADTNSDTLSLYPFSIKVKDNSISWLYSGGTYSYQLNLDLEISHEDQVIIDSNFSTIQFEMVDSLGRVVGTQSATLTGTGKLTNGMQKVVVSGLKNEQVDSGVVVNMYEVINTPNGTAKRLLKQFH